MTMEKKKCAWWFYFMIGFVLVGFCGAKVTHKVTCNDEDMLVELSGPNLLDAYLKGLKNYPEPACLPKGLPGHPLVFRLPLVEYFRCGTSQILNKITGAVTFYNRIVIIEKEGKDSEILVKCKREGDLDAYKESFLRNHNVTQRLRKRDVLPAGFQEQEDPTYYYDHIGHGPEPILTMVVKQEGRTIGQELLVQPGSPLTMEVSHIERPKVHQDYVTNQYSTSSTPTSGRSGRLINEDVYGIIVSKLDVTDTVDQSEVIMINGCTVDPYLFENFAINDDGNTLTAKFRAFKFPDSSYVLFQGTVNVCLGTCTPSQCSNGQIGYGRRRRSVKMRTNEDDFVINSSSNLYEAKVVTLLRIDSPDPALQLEDGTILYQTRRGSGGSRRNNDNSGHRENSNILAEYRSARSSSSDPASLGSSVFVVAFTCIARLLTMAVFR